MPDTTFTIQVKLAWWVHLLRPALRLAIRLRLLSVEQVISLSCKISRRGVCYRRGPRDVWRRVA